MNLMTALKERKPCLLELWGCQQSGQKIENEADRL